MTPDVIEVDPENRALWLKTRQQGIGSSDAAAILGMDKFSTPFSVYVDKVEEPVEEDSPAMEWGRRLEAPVADKFADGHPELVVVKPTVMFRHSEHPFVMVNPDRTTVPKTEPVTVFGTSGVECKTSRVDEEWESGPPDRVLIQMQHQMFGMGWDHEWCACLLHGRVYQEWRIERDDALIDVILRAEAEFWQRVLDRRPPLADGHEATTDALSHLYRNPEPGTTVDLGEHGADLLKRRAALKRAVGEHQEALTSVENELRDLIGDRTLGEIDGVAAVAWTPVKMTRFDAAAFQADHPDLAGPYLKPSNYRRLDVKKGFK